MSRTSTPTPPPERDAQLLSIGQQCSAPLCGLVDFLPFKCAHCNQGFCGDHFLPEGHNCDKFDEFSHNRVAPDCPFCKVPIAIPKGEDPNIRMERHFDNDCPVLTGGKKKSSSTPRCARPKCGKVLFVPIRCDKCNEQFCPKHRFPVDHSCAKIPTASNAKTSASSSSLGSRPNPASAASAAAMAAIKRAMNNPSSPASSRTTPPSGTQTRVQTTKTPTRSNPFSATDRSLPPSPLRIVTNAQTTLSNVTGSTNTDEQHSPYCIPKLFTDSRAVAPPPLFSFA